MYSNNLLKLQLFSVSLEAKKQELPIENILIHTLKVMSGIHQFKIFWLNVIEYLVFSFKIQVGPMTRHTFHKRTHVVNLSTNKVCHKM